MAVPDQTLAAIIRCQVSVGGKRLGHFGFDGLGQQGPCAIAQNLGQRIGNLARLAQGDDFILFHGVSILIWICGWLPPPLIRRLPFLAPSPTLPHSSGAITQELGIGRA
jgi:hypothetical protein